MVQNSLPAPPQSAAIYICLLLRNCKYKYRQTKHYITPSSFVFCKIDFVCQDLTLQRGVISIKLSTFQLLSRREHIQPSSLFLLPRDQRPSRMSDSQRVKSKAMIDSSDSDSDMSDSEFQNVAKKPKLDQNRVKSK